MKIVLICAIGMSTSLIVEKNEKRSRLPRTGCPNYRCSNG